MKRVLFWWDRWALCSGTRDFYPAWVAVVGPVQNKFSLSVHYFSPLVPIAQQAGQSVVLGHLSLCVSGPGSPPRTHLPHCIKLNSFPAWPNEEKACDDWPTAQRVRLDAFVHFALCRLHYRPLPNQIPVL
jgi:hypothetical protein